MIDPSFPSLSYGFDSRYPLQHSRPYLILFGARFRRPLALACAFVIKAARNSLRHPFGLRLLHWSDAGTSNDQVWPGAQPRELRETIFRAENWQENAYFLARNSREFRVS